MTASIFFVLWSIWGYRWGWLQLLHRCAAQEWTAEADGGVVAASAPVNGAAASPWREHSHIITCKLIASTNLASGRDRDQFGKLDLHAQTRSNNGDRSAQRFSVLTFIQPLPLSSISRFLNPSLAYPPYQPIRHDAARSSNSLFDSSGPCCNEHDPYPSISLHPPTYRC